MVGLLYIYMDTPILGNLHALAIQHAPLVLASRAESRFGLTVLGGPGPEGAVRGLIKVGISVKSDENTIVTITIS
jgi:hypothetical protein